jgi:hypothetical protein
VVGAERGEDVPIVRTSEAKSGAARRVGVVHDRAFMFGADEAAVRCGGCPLLTKFALCKPSEATSGAADHVVIVLSRLWPLAAQVNARYWLLNGR